jgi:hypothetical protein
MRPAPALMLILCLTLAGPSPATAKKAKAEAAEKVAKPAKAKAKKSGGSAPKFIKGGEESTAERDRRLYRECKGRVNAGACSGYTG